VEKANFRRLLNPLLSEFSYPYDLGWFRNLKQVFYDSEFKEGDGIEYAVRDGCDQYTLTVSISLEFQAFYYFLYTLFLARAISTESGETSSYKNI